MSSVRLAMLAAVTMALAGLSGPATVVAASTAAALPAAAPASACDMPDGSVEGPPNSTYSIRPVGTVRAVMIFVDFPDAPTTESTQPYFDLLAPARAWLRTASYQAVKLKIDRVDQWFRMPHDSTDYDFQRGLSFDTHKAYIADALAAADASVDFSPYDIVYIVPPTSAAAISFSPAFLGGPNGVSVDGHVIGFAATFGQDIWNAGWGYRVLAHETGHLFGLPDLYAFEAGDDYWDIHRFVGGWDVMGYVGTPTPDYFAWHKWHLGWLPGSQIRCLSAVGQIKVTLSPVETVGGVKLAIVKTSNTSAYAVEVRARLGNDMGACRTGVLIYRILGSTASGAGPIRVKPSAADDPSKVDACMPLYAAPFKVGQTMQAGNVRIKVRAHTGSDFMVTIARDPAG